MIDRHGHRRLEDSADQFALSLIPYALRTVAVVEKALIECLGRTLAKEQKDWLSVELLVLYMHVSDRTAFEYLSAEHRQVFSDRLCIRTEATLISGEVTGRPEILWATGLRGIYNDRQAEYAAHEHLFAERTEPSAGALVWEFSKTMAEQAGDPFLTIPISVAVGSMLVPFLQIAEDALCQ